MVRAVCLGSKARRVEGGHVPVESSSTENTLVADSLLFLGSLIEVRCLLYGLRLATDMGMVWYHSIVLDFMGHGENCDHCEVVTVFCL